MSVKGGNTMNYARWSTKEELLKVLKANKENYNSETQDPLKYNGTAYNIKVMHNIPTSVTYTYLGPDTQKDLGCWIIYSPESTFEIEKNFDLIEFIEKVCKTLKNYRLELESI